MYSIGSSVCREPDVKDQVTADLTGLMGQAAGLLEQLSDVPPLDLTLDLSENTIELKAPLGTPLGDARPAVDRVAEVLGAHAALKTITRGVYSYSVHGEWDGVPVSALAVTPINTSAASRGARTTTAPQAAAVLRELIPWARALDARTVRSFGVLDQTTTYLVQIGISHPTDRAGATDAVFAGLPSTVDHQWHGSWGHALLPTGHTLNVFTTTKHKRRGASMTGSEPVPAQIPIPINLVVLRSLEDGSPLFPAHQVPELLRNLAGVFREHPEMDPAEGLAALADQLDLIVITALSSYTEGDK
jgi:hypothetical protein